MKDSRLSFQKIYRKSQISFSFFEKIAIEVDCFLQKSLQKPQHLWSLTRSSWAACDLLKLKNTWN
jgi:hypothetical protein